MVALSIWSNLLVRLPLLLGFGVGVAVGIALVIRRRDAIAGLALAGFALLLAVQVGAWLLGVLPIWLATGGTLRLVGLIAWLNVAFNLVAAGGALCLVAALWMGLSKR